MKRCWTVFWTGLLAARAAGAQGVPSTDIYLADLRVDDGRVMVGAPVNVTNRPGYDNQPFFLPDGRGFLYTSIREDGQADIYRYDLPSGTIARVTTTAESEYSPTPLPGGDGFSVVRVEADSTQRLWAFDRDGTHPRVVLDSIKPVGYHAWSDQHTLGLFVLGSPPTLRLADTRTGQAEVVARDIGRGLHQVPGRDAISFVQKDSSGWWVREIDLHTREIRPLARTLENVDFLAWTPGGTLLMAQGAKLYQWRPAPGAGWEEIADFTPQGLTTVSRLAVSPAGDRIALVAVPGAPKP